MTYAYTDRCGTVKTVGNFWHLLFLWKASIYKLVWADLLIFLFLYYSLGLCYHFLLEGRTKEIFELVSFYCASQMSFIPLSFVLGFYVSNVISRWEKMFNALPGGDNIAISVAACIRGKDDKSRMLRRTIMRYVNASHIMLMMTTCIPIKKRFPTFDHLVVVGMLHEQEKKILEEFHDKVPYNIYWVPLIWAANIVSKAREDNIIESDFHEIKVLDQIKAFKGECGTILTYTWISIPLVYTQVVTLAVYTFFLAAILGRQVLEHEDKGKPTQTSIDIYFPIFTILQFLFYMGWLKVAETLLNPFGEDDDDFEISWLVDRNLRISFAIVDECHMVIPQIRKDQFWDKVIPDALPEEIQLGQVQMDLDPKIPVNENFSSKRDIDKKSKIFSASQVQHVHSKIPSIKTSSKTVAFTVTKYLHVERYWQTVFSPRVTKYLYERFPFNLYSPKNEPQSSQLPSKYRDQDFNLSVMESSPELRNTISVQSSQQTNYLTSEAEVQEPTQTFQKRSCESGSSDK